MTTRSTYGRRLGAAALGVGLGLLAFGVARSVTNPATDDDTTTEAITTEDTDESASGTKSQGSAPTVAGITITREPRSPMDGTDDYSLIIIGAGMAVAGGASLRLSNRRITAATRPYRPRHRR